MFEFLEMPTSVHGRTIQTTQDTHRHSCGIGVASSCNHTANFGGFHQPIVPVRLIGVRVSVQLPEVSDSARSLIKRSFDIVLLIYSPLLSNMRNFLFESIIEQNVLTVQVQSSEFDLQSVKTARTMTGALRTSVCATSCNGQQLQCSCCLCCHQKRTPAED